uniref:tRNA-splicing endonuclease subunit Sen34 n=1 Tax=Clastoptera arizonana TaxID=38151 RepID=A0A1B6CWN3_9HEMI
MISINIVNEIGYIWNAEDWEVLRKKHRIVGNLIGSLANLPRQDQLLGLPATLLPEEITLLLEKEIAFAVCNPSLLLPPGEDIKQKYLNHKEKVKKEQTECYEKERKKQVTSMIDRIIEGKRKKLSESNVKKFKGAEDDKITEVESLEESEKVIDREEILNQELNKEVTIAPGNYLAQTFTADPWIHEDELQKVDWNFPSTSREKLKYSIFKDLWEKGYYVSSGSKFGGDFLVYPGDPIKFHAQFIVTCLEAETNFPAKDLIVYGRLGTTTRKTFVFATQLPETEEIVYQSLQWTDKF